MKALTDHSEILPPGDFLGLESLARAIGSFGGHYLSAVEAAYLVRQINIGTGCLNQCDHCFANSSRNLVQMGLSGFMRLAKEFGRAAAIRGDEYSFLFLGCETDPAMIRGFAKYLQTWIVALPAWQSVKFYTHGWDLSSQSQTREFVAVLDILARYCRRIKTINLSIDRFNDRARHDWGAYLANISANLKELLILLPLEAIRLHVMYPIDRLGIGGKHVISYWRKRARTEAPFPSYHDIISTLGAPRSPARRDCSDLTRAVFTIGDMAGLESKSIARISRDGGVPIPAGRARNMFVNHSQADVEKALRRYRIRDLQSIKNSPYGFHGILLMPDGSARWVDYACFRLGKWLDRGKPVIPYLKGRAFSINVPFGDG